MTYDEWCDLLSTIKVKDERKRAAAQIKKINSDRAASLSDSNDFFMIPRKKKARTGILSSNKGPHKKAHKHHGTQCYCVLFKKAGMSQRKYMACSVKNCTGVCTNQKIKDGMGVSVVIRADTVNQYKKSKKMEEGSESSQEAKQDAL